uniref:COMM domain containing 4 n=1 Tax=Varanus komodoensis TaxID=61221 RepID=A0A8D2IMM7_VARKO
ALGSPRACPRAAQLPLFEAPSLARPTVLLLLPPTLPESGDVKAAVAVLSFIFSSAAKHQVDSDSLSSELQQLGLPKEHVAGLCRSYEEKQAPLQDSLRRCSLRLNCLDSVSWRVDYTLSSSELRQVNEPVVHLKLKVKDVDRGVLEPVALTLSAEKFRVLLAGEKLNTGDFSLSLSAVAPAFDQNGQGIGSEKSCMPIGEGNGLQRLG